MSVPAGSRWGTIAGLPPFYRANQLRTFLTGHGVTFVYLEKSNLETAASLAFSSSAAFDAAVSLFPLELSTPRGARTLTLRPCARRTAAPPQPPVPDAPRARSTAPRNVHKSVTPLYEMPYAEQLLKKARDVHFALVRCSRNLAELVGAAAPVVRPKRARADEGSDSDSFADAGGNSEVTDAGAGAGGARPLVVAAAPSVLLPNAKLPLELLWLRGRVDALNGAMCIESSIVPSPVERHYRNKVCWTAGVDERGQKVWGFFCGAFTSASHDISAAHSYAHVPLVFMPIATAGNDFLEGSSFPPYEDSSHEGTWRTLTVRWSRRERRALVEVLATPSADTAAFSRELDRFVTAMRSVKREDGEPLVAGVFVQEYEGSSSPGPNHPRRLLYGADSLTDSYPSLNLFFRVSLGAFLQVNDAGAEKLYAVVRAFAIDGIAGGRALLGESLPGRRAAPGATAAPSTLSWVDGGVGPLPTKRPSMALLDVCCGGGLIGLACAPFVGKVIGIDECETAIADARVNAALNGFSDAGDVARLRFECAKAEAVMGALLPEALAAAGITGVVAVVDPPRSGLHPSVIASLRACKVLKRIVYVSCNPTKSFIVDAKRLCGPGGVSSAKFEPFHPVASVPFDLFPQTAGVELVTLFER